MHPGLARYHTFTELFKPFTPAATAQIVGFMRGDAYQIFYRGLSKSEIRKQYVTPSDPLYRYGIQELREAVARWLAAHTSLEYAEETEEVLD